jgi:hypothetical protein
MSGDFSKFLEAKGIEPTLMTSRIGPASEICIDIVLQKIAPCSNM